MSSQSPRERGAGVRLRRRQKAGSGSWWFQAPLETGECKGGGSPQSLQKKRSPVRSALSRMTSQELVLSEPSYGNLLQKSQKTETVSKHFWWSIPISKTKNQLTLHRCIVYTIKQTKTEMKKDKTKRTEEIFQNAFLSLDVLTVQKPFWLSSQLSVLK